MATASETPIREKLEHAGKMHWIHWMVVCLSIVLTVAAWQISREQVTRAAEQRFLRETDQVIEIVRERMKLYENALWGGVALVDSNGGAVDYPLWLRYANSLSIDEAYPGINGIGVIFHIRPAELEGFLARERSWRPEFEMHPRHELDDFWPITYIEPAGINQKAIGLDMAFESNRYNGILKARDTGMAQVTGPITLVQDAAQTPGFLFYTPFYLKGGKPAEESERREKIAGVIYAPFIMYKLMQGVLASKNRHVSIIIRDGGTLLFEDRGNIDNDGIDPDPLFSKQSNMQMYGREWSLAFTSNLSFREAVSSSQPNFILVGGIFIDTLLLALFLFLTKANRRALSYADEMTAELNQKTDRLEKSNADLEQFAYIASHDLKSPLNAINKLVSWIEEDLGDRVEGDSRGHLQLLRSRSDRMNQLLDDLLSYARVGRSDYAVDAVRLQEVCDSIMGLLDNAEVIILEVDDCELRVPRVPFELVLRNMISNAQKHHDLDQARIRVSGRVEGAIYRITVEDDGPGIPSQLRGKAREMFQTLKPRDKVEGSGMGLAIAIKTVEHYGGQLEIDSNGDRGTKILITWPRASQQ